MISFHPTISFRLFWKLLTTSYDNTLSEQELAALFPNHAITLTDSGRSAFSLAIETLGLEGKTIVLPAYICDILLPTLIHHKITPLFVDIDEETYQPPKSAYTKEVLEKADAALLVATYGKLPSREVLDHLKGHGITIIEDFAHRDPRVAESLVGAARIYSLPKAFAAPDGGLLVLRERRTVRKLSTKRFSLAYAKDFLKLFPLVGPSLATIRREASRSLPYNEWRTPTRPSGLTVKLLRHALRDNRQHSPELYYPLRTSNPKSLERALANSGITAERLWYRPLIMHPSVARLFGVRQDNFPHTLKVASEIVCAPLWHIRSDKEYKRYKDSLEKAIADCGEKRVE